MAVFSHEKECLYYLGSSGEMCYSLMLLIERQILLSAVLTT